VFLGAPWIERIAEFPKLSAALAAITACVTGVVLTLGVDFARAALFPEAGGFDGFVLVVAILSFAALRKFRVPIAWTIAAAGLAGLARHLVF
jgi:chromate transporter